MKRKLVISLLLFAGLLVAACFIVPWHQPREAQPPPEPANRLPDAVYEALLKDPGLVLLSLDPDRRKVVGGSDQFHGYLILGETVVGSADSRQSLAATLQRALAAWDGGNSMCFIPRHGLRATHGGSTFEFVICFECGRLFVYPSTGESFSHELTGEAGPFHDLLVAAKVPITPPK